MRTTYCGLSTDSKSVISIHPKKDRTKAKQKFAKSYVAARAQPYPAHVCVKVRVTLSARGRESTYTEAISLVAATSERDGARRRRFQKRYAT